MIRRAKSAFSRTVAPAIYRAMGMDVFGFNAWLEETKHWTAEARQTWRLQRLNEIIRFCWEHVPFYRQYWSDHGLRPFDLKSFEELGAFPIMTKALLQSNPETLRPDSLSTIPHKNDATGGSTGEPIRHRQDLSTHSLRFAFLEHYGWGLAGYRYGDPWAIISGGRLLPEMHKRWSRSRVRTMLNRALPLIGVHMDSDLAERYHRLLLQHGTLYLHGYPSILAEFARHLNDKGLRIPDLKAVFTTAEMLLPQYRATIEKGLGVKVWDSYGCNDGGVLAWECKLHEGQHYNDLESILEVVEPGSDGVGRLLITNLWNKSLPYVRYENGDLVSLAKDRCPCGEPFPMLASIQGRTAELLVFANGRSITGPALTLVFRQMAIRGWQVVQTSPRDVEVRIRSERELSEIDAQYILKVFAEHAGSDVTVTIKRVDELQKTKEGKLKPIWVDFAAS